MRRSYAWARPDRHEVGLVIGRERLHVLVDQLDLIAVPPDSRPARPKHDGGNSAYLTGRQPGAFASNKAARINFTRNDLRPPRPE
jgi:hypothetical protein